MVDELGFLLVTSSKSNENIVGSLQILQIDVFSINMGESGAYFQRIFSNHEKLQKPAKERLLFDENFKTKTKRFLPIFFKYYFSNTPKSDMRIEIRWTQTSRKLSEIFECEFGAFDIGQVNAPSHPLLTK